MAVQAIQKTTYRHCAKAFGVWNQKSTAEKTQASGIRGNINSRSSLTRIKYLALVAVGGVDSQHLGVDPVVDAPRVPHRQHERESFFKGYREGMRPFAIAER